MQHNQSFATITNPINLSAWKQFFFIDCIGIGGNGRSRNNDSKSGSNKDRTESIGGGNVIVDSGNNKTTADCFGGTGNGRQMRNRKTSARSSIAHNVKSSSSSTSKMRRNSKTTVKSPSNKALLQTDPLFHLYLICVGLITLSILAIKCLIPGMPIYTHTMIGFAFLLATIVVSAIYTQAKSRKVSSSGRGIVTFEQNRLRQP